MRARLRRITKARVAGLSLALMVVSYFTFSQTSWVKYFAEKKVSSFMDNKLDVRIGQITGGVIRDMSLQEVEFISGTGEGAKVFAVERMEISYRVWRILLEKLGLAERTERPLEEVGVYFSEENPFLQGFFKIYSYPEKLELVGHVSLALFGEEEKKGLKGSLFKRDDGRYDCDLVWNGSLKIKGVLDPAGRSVDLGFDPVSSRKGTVRLKAGIGRDRAINAYTRLDKVRFGAVELIGDVWLSYREPSDPVFQVKAENLVVNKRPFWDISLEGTYSREGRYLSIEQAKWGRAFILFGRISTKAPYPSKLGIRFSHADLSEIGAMLGNSSTPLEGMAEGELSFDGPVLSADVTGRLHVGQGVLNNMTFRSISAQFRGKLPLVRVVDSRVFKEGGFIKVEGEMDFSRFAEGKAFEKVIFSTDNKVAVWEDWQITKKEDSNKVSATRDKVTLTTSMEEAGFMPREDPIQNELGVNYSLDRGSSLKFEMEEDDDFFGLEHKIEF
ncbi:MAG: hypothetical protein GF409_00710 [Candidatus Omnitrophica bacterium]|nr:hypothetical protein [Candidatus Omnitrophota bacterium]